MKQILLLTTVLALSGCITLDNRVSCTVAKDKAFIISQYGSVGVASTIADKDREVICK